MRIPVHWVGMSLPFIEVIETVAVRILFQDVGIGNGQSELLDPFIRHWRMHFGGLQGGGLSVRADEMFLRNKKPGTPAEGPLRRLSQLLQSIFGLFGFPGRRSGPLGGMRLQVGELRLEPDRALENAKGANQQDCDTRDQNDALVIFLQPVHQRYLVLSLLPFMPLGHTHARNLFSCHSERSRGISNYFEISRLRSRRQWSRISELLNR